MPLVRKNYSTFVCFLHVHDGQFSVVFVHVGVAPAPNRSLFVQMTVIVFLVAVAVHAIQLAVGSGAVARTLRSLIDNFL